MSDLNNCACGKRKEEEEEHLRQRLKPNLFFSKVSGLPCPALRMSAYSSFLLGHHPFVIVIVNCNLDLLPLAQQVNINFYPTQVRSFGYPCQCLTNGLTAV